MAKRRIIKANIRFLSLCERGKNNLATIYKGDGQDGFGGELLVKGFDEETGELTAVVYAPEKEDLEGDIASSEVIKDAMYAAMRDGIAIDLKHDFRPLDSSKAFIAQTFLVQKGDPRFADTKDYSGTPVDVTGAWGVILKIEDPDLRAKYREGKWGGVSMGGTAIYTTAKADEPSEDDMKPEEIKALTNSITDSITKAINDSLVAGLKPIANAKGELALKAARLRKMNLLKGASADTLSKVGLLAKRDRIIDEMDPEDPDSIEVAAAELGEIEKQIVALDASKKVEKADSDPAILKLTKQIEDATKELTALRGRSQQPVNKGDGKDDAASPFMGLEKSADGTDIAAMARLGSEMAAYQNKRNGRA